MTQWAAQIQSKDVFSLGLLRLWPSVEVCESGQEIWVRGDNYCEETDLVLRKLPGAFRYTVQPDSKLLAAGCRIPKGALPGGPWVSLSEYLKLDIQVPKIAGRLTSQVRLQLVPSERERPANMYLTDLQAWVAFVSTASEVRLKPLTFAVSADEMVLVRGLPVPPVPGLGMLEQDNIVIPCGYCWKPEVPAKVLHGRFGVKKSDLIVMYPNGKVEVLGEDCFVKSLRSAARLTTEYYQSG